MRQSRLKDAVTEPVTIEQVKSDLILAGNADDELISDWIVSFRQLVEEHVKLSLLTQTRRVSFKLNELENNDRFILPRPPIQSITSVTYTDQDGNVDSYVANDDYRQEEEWIVFTTAPFKDIDHLEEDVGRFIVDYTAGYTSVDDVPRPISNAIRNATAAHYENREMFVLPPAVRTQLAPYRRGRLL